MRITFLTGLLLLCLCGLPGSQLARASDSLPITRVLVLPDTSGSLDVREYEACLRAVVVQLRQLSESWSVAEVAVLPWATAADCRRTPVWARTLPRRTIVPETKLQLDESGRLFRRSRELEVEKANRLRELAQQEADGRFQEQLEPYLDQLEQELLGCRQRQARCTSISGVIRRCSQESGSTLAVVITDGKPECERFAPGSLPEGARTLIVLVPSRDEASGQELSARVHGLRQIAPWAVVLPSFRFSDSAFHWAAVLGDASASRAVPAISTAFQPGDRGLR